MPDQLTSLSTEQKDHILRRYGAQPSTGDLTYGTIRDFCDSSDHLSFLTNIQGDLKDLQRPAALKAILGIFPPGSSLLEIGAGEPYVANTLVELGYKVTVVDPYDGSGHGPTEFEYYLDRYPNVKIIRSLFSEDLPELAPNSLDCIYSISVLEHVHQPALSGVFKGITHFLRKGGFSLQLIDHVLEGPGADFFRKHLTEITMAQSALAGDLPAQAAYDLMMLLQNLERDLETYYLSAEGHNRWRGGAPYDSFPFRKVASVHSLKRKR